MKHNRVFEICAIIMMVLFCIYFIISTYDLSIMSAMFPRIVSITTLLLIIIYIFTEYLKVHRSKSEKTNHIAKNIETIPEIKKGILWQISLSYMIGYLLLIYLIGFGMATVCYSIGLVYKAGYRNLLVVTIFAFSMFIIVQFGFSYGFSIPLPEFFLWKLLLQ